ncbi:MAG: glycosyltransferase, partial [Candidatus Cryptobacteroides sp.]
MEGHKILWIADNPCSSAERGGESTVTGGWHSALEAQIRDKVSLSIAFLSSAQKQEDFIHKGVIYHSITPFSSKNYLLFRLKRLLMPQRVRDREVLESVRRIIRQESPDLIHIHGTEKCFGMICPSDGSGMYLLDGKRIPVLVSIQGMIGAITERFF